MKKLVSILLALVLALGLTLSAFAALPANDVNEGTGIGTKTGEVKITVNDGVDTTVYYVTVEWSNLEFTYQKEGSGTWNPESHTYSDATSDGWVVSTAEGVNDAVSGVNNDIITRTDAITVTNHSNADVKVDATFGTTTSSAVTATLSNQDATEGIAVELESAAEGTHLNNVNDADKVIYSLTLTGAPGEGESSSFTLGTITVSINPKTTT